MTGGKIWWRVWLQRNTSGNWVTYIMHGKTVALVQKRCKSSGVSFFLSKGSGSVDTGLSIIPKHRDVSSKLLIFLSLIISPLGRILVQLRLYILRIMPFGMFRFRNTSEIMNPPRPAFPNFYVQQTHFMVIYNLANLLQKYFGMIVSLPRAVIQEMVSSDSKRQ